MLMNDGDDRADVDAFAAGEDLPFEGAAPPHFGPPSPPDPRDERIVADDCCAPPKIPCECYCLHCRRTFWSTEIWLQRVKNAQAGDLDGFWMCPTPNCDGKGFSFDIFPTDPEHPANADWCDDDEEFDDEDEWDDEDFDMDDDFDDFGDDEYDPTEAKWKELDGVFGEDDDDIEGEEWKYGLQPGERPEEVDWLIGLPPPLSCEEYEARYDQPDQRPREMEREPYEGEISEDDIPF